MSSREAQNADTLSEREDTRREYQKTTAKTAVVFSLFKDFYKRSKQHQRRNCRTNQLRNHRCQRGKRIYFRLLPCKARHERCDNVVKQRKQSRKKQCRHKHKRMAFNSVRCIPTLAQQAKRDCKYIIVNEI